MKISILRVDVQITLLYVLFGGLWILLSDRVLAFLVTDAEMITSWQTYKGWAFVVCSALLTFLLLRRERRMIADSEARLRESEEKFRLFMDSGPWVAWINDEQANFIYTNRMHRQRLGSSPSEKTAFEVHPSEIGSKIQESDLLALSENRVVEEIVELPEPKGKNFWWKFKFPLHDAHGKKFIGGIGIDVSERHRAEQALRETEQRFSAVFHASPVGITIRRLEDGRLVDVNDAFLAMVGYAKDEMLDRTSADLGLWADKGDRTKFFATLQEQGRVRSMEVKYRHKSGKVGYELGSAEIIEIDGVKYIVSMASDITERKHAEEEIRRRADEFASLYETARDLAGQQELSALLQAIAIRSAHLLNATRGSIHFYDPAERESVFAISTDASNPAIGGRLKLGQGLVGKVAEKRETIIIDRYSEWEHRHSYMQGYVGMEAAIGTPMINHGELLGVITVGEAAPTTRKFTSEEARLLSLFAEYAAGAVHYARMRQATERNLRRVQALHQIDQAISSNLDLVVTMNMFLLHASVQLGVDAADILLLDPVTNILQYIAGIGFRTQALQHTHLRLGAGLAGRAALERKTLYIADLRHDNDGFGQSPFSSTEDFVGYHGVPLIAKGMVNGVLEVFHRRAVQTDEEWNDFLETLAGQAAIAIENTLLFENLQRSNADLSLAYDATIEGWSRALDLRDRETEGHTVRVTELFLRLARAIGVEDGELVHFRRGALLHDIGKMGVPDSILLKAGPLSVEERKIMQRHPFLAFEMLSPIAYLKQALDIPYCHHEKWNGMGYPRGLHREQIPLAARVFAAVDVWDALRSDRPYRPAWQEEKVLEYLQSEASQQFDPHVVQVFMRLLNSEK
jgi:PAS domain S-box-containing protein/putative nucleotidyltransferase with HDIG domain